jgi:hypothetical protein
MYSNIDRLYVNILQFINSALRNMYSCGDRIKIVSIREVKKYKVENN